MYNPILAWRQAAQSARASAEAAMEAGAVGTARDFKRLADQYEEEALNAEKENAHEHE